MREQDSGLSSSQQIIADIRDKTGMSFLHIEGIDTSRPEIAAVVLPVLEQWVPFVEDDNVRGAIYTRFVSAYAYPYLASIFDWATRERDRLNTSVLGFAIAKLLRPCDAQQVWIALHEMPRPEYYYLALARLAAFPSTSVAAREELVRALETANLPIGDLEHIAKVDDPRIRRWFEAQTNAPHAVIRTLARRVANRGRRLPRGVQVVTVSPDHGRELFSTEVDLENVPALLREMSERYGFQIPSGIRSGSFLTRLEVDQWARIGVRTKVSETLFLWFRLEDVDTVEVLVSPDQSQAG